MRPAYTTALNMCKPLRPLRTAGTPFFLDVDFLATLAAFVVGFFAVAFLLLDAVAVFAAAPDFLATEEAVDFFRAAAFEVLLTVDFLDVDFLAIGKV